MFKKTIVLALVSAVAGLTIACGNSAEDACEHVNEICASQQGFQKADCSKSSEEYDKLSDSDKEKADKIADCVTEKDKCEDVIACATSGG